MPNKPPVIHEAPPPPSVVARQGRQLQYLVVLAQEAGVDVKKLTSENFLYAISSPYERRGYTSKDIAAWVATCDPVKPPTWDPVDCFRQKAQAALNPGLGLAVPVAMIGVVAFLGAFFLSDPKR